MAGQRAGHPVPRGGAAGDPTGINRLGDARRLGSRIKPGYGEEEDVYDAEKS
jgi:hypothetical protein